MLARVPPLPAACPVPRRCRPPRGSRFRSPRPLQPRCGTAAPSPHLPAGPRVPGLPLSRPRPLRSRSAVVLQWGKGGEKGREGRGAGPGRRRFGRAAHAEPEVSPLRAEIRASHFLSNKRLSRGMNPLPGGSGKPGLSSLWSLQVNAGRGSFLYLLFIPGWETHYKKPPVRSPGPRRAALLCTESALCASYCALLRPRSSQPRSRSAQPRSRSRSRSAAATAGTFPSGGAARCVSEGMCGGAKVDFGEK